MFVTLKRHRELENHYNRLADYAARINLENSRLRAEVGELKTELEAIEGKIVNLRVGINDLARDAEGPRCSACGEPIEGGRSDLCYGCS